MEIVLWALAFLAGVASAIGFVTRRRWLLPAAVTFAAVGTLFLLTFVQPALWIRMVLDALLWAGVVPAFRR